MPEAHRHGRPGDVMNTEKEILKMENLKVRVDAYERTLVQEALKTAKGKQSRAARILGTSQRIVNYKIRKYSIDTGQFR
jgi:Nif-specific regulatory protein